MNSANDDDLTPMAADLLGEGESALVRLSGGAAALIPQRAERLTPEQHGAFVELERHAIELAQLQGHVRQLVGSARAVGISWSLIGWATGLTGEGARTRYGDSDPGVMTRRRPAGRRKR